MLKQKIAKTVVAGFFILPVIGNLQIQRNINLTATPTASPTSTPLYIKPNLLQKIKLVENKFMNKRGVIKDVSVTAIGASDITIDDNGVSVKVDIQANTHFRRKFWGKSSITEISVGDKVDVIGKWKNEERIEITAILIRDLSIQKRKGVFFGVIKSLNDKGFVMTTIQRGEETVILGTAKIINRKGETILIKDILAGDKVRVRGLWDAQKSTITEVAEVKDFSLPVQATPTASPTTTR